MKTACCTLQSHYVHCTLRNGCSHSRSAYCWRCRRTKFVCTRKRIAPRNSRCKIVDAFVTISIACNTVHQTSFLPHWKQQQEPTALFAPLHPRRNVLVCEASSSLALDRRRRAILGTEPSSTFFGYARTHHGFHSHRGGCKGRQSCKKRV